MNEMVEKVKDALKVGLAACDSEHEGGLGVTDAETDMLARAAIRALMEPTDEMLNASIISHRATIQVLKAVLTAALGEEGAG